MKKTDFSRYSAWVAAAAVVLGLAACSDDKTPTDSTTGANPTPLNVQSVIFEPKVGTPGDTLVFTAVITSSSQNEGDFPAMTWSATGGTFVETNKQSVRWVAPGASGLFTITAKATNAANSSTNKATVFVGTGGRLISQYAGQVDLIGTGPDFHFLRSVDVTRGVDVYKYVAGSVSDAVSPAASNNLTVTYSPDGLAEAHAADSLMAAVTVRPRNIYVGDFASGTLKRLTRDGAKPGSPERNQCKYPSFSPNGQVVAYQRWAQSWDGVAPDSFHVYIQDLVAQKRTLVTYDYPFPRGFFPTFSTDGKWLVYVLDKTRSGQFDLFGSPMTGNNVDGAPASAVRFTDTGGQIVTGVPKELKKPPMIWNPVSSILAVAAADNVLYLVATTSSGANVIAVSEVAKATEIAWSPAGNLLAATYAATIQTGPSDTEVHARLVTVSTAGVVTQRAEGLAGDKMNDLAFSPDGNWLLYRVTRGGGSWFNVVDVGAGKLTEPVPVTATNPTAAADDYRAVMLFRPAWSAANLIIYPAFEFSTDETPGIYTRDLAGLVN